MTVSSDSAEDRIVATKSCCSGSSRVDSASSLMPMMPFIGVRISWLTLARNSDLRRNASSPASRASGFNSSITAKGCQRSPSPSCAL